MIGWLRRLVTQDLARKLLALLFALVLFDVLDRKVQADDRLTAQLVYVDESALGRVPEAPDRTCELVVAQRGAGGKPLVVASRPRPDAVTLAIHATRDAIERAKSRRHRFTWKLGKEGALTPEANELVGVDALLEELGPGARVTVTPPVTFQVEVEETRTLALDDSWLRVDGNPARGYDRRARTVVIRPTEVRVVGPQHDVIAAEQRKSDLFEPVVLDGTRSEVTQDVRLAAEWRDRLLLEDANGAELSALRVALEFRRRMAPVPAPDGLFELPVHVVCNDELLRRKDDKKSWRDGWRLDFEQAHGRDLVLQLQVLRPESSSAAPLDRVKVDLAKDNVELVVRAHEAAGVERTRVAVTIQKFADFPDDLDVVFPDGSRRADVDVTWTRPAASSADKEKSSGHGGE